MKIQVLGAGCSKCKRLLETTKKIVKELGLDVEVEYTTDVSEMIEMGVMTTPVLAVNGKPVLTGDGKSEDDVRNALEKNSKDNNTKAGGCSCGGNC